MKLLLLILLPLALFCKEIEKEALHQIGLKVWQNECRGTLDGLITWNAQEEFPSLGIGHFIWYPVDAQKKFEETFPSLIAFLKEKGTEVPSWIASKKGCPWKNRETFLADKRSKKMIELRDLLSTTLDLQILFLLERFKLAENKLSPQLTEKEKLYLEKLKTTPQGLYALIDYVNFKGTGLSSEERYRGQGWGLLQVLQTIPENIPDETLVSEFANSAKKVLLRRVKNSPPQREEEQWLNGWNKRLETYTSK